MLNSTFANETLPEMNFVLEESYVALSADDLERKFSFVQLKAIADAMGINSVKKGRYELALAISEEGMTIEAAIDILQ